MGGRCEGYGEEDPVVEEDLDEGDGHYVVEEGDLDGEEVQDVEEELVEEGHVFQAQACELLQGGVGLVVGGQWSLGGLAGSYHKGDNGVHSQGHYEVGEDP